MPFVFNGSAFTGPQQSPLGTFMTSMFGTAAQEYPRAFEDARKEKQFQAEMDLKNKALGLEQQRYDTAQAKDTAERKNTAALMAPGLEADTPQSKPQMGQLAGAAAGGAMGGAMGGMSPLDAYAAQHQQRVQQLQQHLEGLSPDNQRALVGIYHTREQEAKHNAFSDAAADSIDKQLQMLQRQDLGFGVDKVQGVDPTYATAAAQHAELLKAAGMALRAHQDPDPNRTMQTLAQGEAVLQQMKLTHQRAMSQFQTYSALHQQDVDKLQQYRLLQHNDPTAVNADGLDMMEDRVQQQQGLLEERAQNLDMPPEHFSTQWNSVQHEWRSQTLRYRDPEKDLSTAITHAQWLHSQAQTAMDRLTKSRDAGSISPEEFTKQSAPIQAEIDRTMGAIQDLMSGKKANGGAPAAPQYDPPTTGPSQQGPPTEDPMGAIVEQIAPLLADGKIGEAIKALGGSQKDGGLGLAREQVNQIIEAAKPKASEISAARAKSGSSTLRRGAAQYSEATAKDKAATDEFRSAVGGEPPKTREEWIAQLETLLGTVEDEDKTAAENTPEEDPATAGEYGYSQPPVMPTKRGLWANKGVQLLRRIGAIRGYAPATEDEIKKIFKVQ